MPKRDNRTNYEGRKMREEHYGTHSNNPFDRTHGITPLGNPLHHNTYGTELPTKQPNNYGRIALATLGTIGAAALTGSYLYTMSRLENQIKPRGTEYPASIRPVPVRRPDLFSKQAKLARKVFLNPFNLRQKPPPEHVVVSRDGGESYYIYPGGV